MKINQFDIWLADLNPRRGTEPGKTRPVLIVQTNSLNFIGHTSTIVCPITTNVELDSDILRVHLQKINSNLKEESDILIDQIRAIDNLRLIKKIGQLPPELIKKVKENISIVLDL